MPRITLHFALALSITLGALRVDRQASFDADTRGDYPPALRASCLLWTPCTLYL